MPRPPRYEIADIPQHVVQRGHNRRRVFFSARDRYRYLEWLARAARECSCAVHAYVLMGNHVHLLVTPRLPLAISEMMQGLGTRYARYINDRRERRGALWEGRHKACLVDTESYFLACHRYIELNPVRAGIVDDPARYRWSSFRSNALGRSDPLVTRHPVYESLGRDRASCVSAYRELFATDLTSAELEQIRDDLNKSTISPAEINGLAGSV